MVIRGNDEFPKLISSPLMYQCGKTSVVNKTTKVIKDAVRRKNESLVLETD